MNDLDDDDADLRVDDVVVEPCVDIIDVDIDDKPKGLGSDDESPATTDEPALEYDVVETTRGVDVMTFWLLVATTRLDCFFIMVLVYHLRIGCKVECSLGISAE